MPINHVNVWLCFQTGWGWDWGSSLLSVASESVSTFTKEVGK